MGTFDTVKYKGNCPNCGTEITSWQTKNSYCVFETIEPWQTDSFYGQCPNCNTWVDAKVNAETELIVKKCEVELYIDKKSPYNKSLETDSRS